MSKTPKVRECRQCKQEMSRSQTSCPHCGDGPYYPNVDWANDADEQAKLDKRYAEALATCDSNGTRTIAAEFEADCATSNAVMALSVKKLHRHVSSGTDIFETYYQLEELTNRVTGSSKLDWAKLRPQAEIELLGDHKNIHQIYYACLSIDGHYLTNYGKCVGTLSEPMVAPRVSCFEGNTAVQYHRRRSFVNLVRSDWANRGKLCVAMFGSDLTTTTTTTDFPSIIVRDKGGIDDIFVEVHVFGTLTARSFESVWFDRGNLSNAELVYVQEISDKFNAGNVKVL